MSRLAEIIGIALHRGAKALRRHVATIHSHNDRGYAGCVRRGHTGALCPEEVVIGRVAEHHVEQVATRDEAVLEAQRTREIINQEGEQGIAARCAKIDDRAPVVAVVSERVRSGKRFSRRIAGNRR